VAHSSVEDSADAAPKGLNGYSFSMTEQHLPGWQEENHLNPISDSRMYGVLGMQRTWRLASTPSGRARMVEPAAQTATFEIGLNIQLNIMAYKNTVLSLNPDGQKLRSQESALRGNGFEVISVPTPLQARFEIEMGRCGVFLTSHITPLPICRDLISLFRVSCPDGTVVFLTSPSLEQALEADIVFSAQDDPQAVVKRLCSYQEKKAS
jgi:hypothetical protein